MKAKGAGKNGAVKSDFEVDIKSIFDCIDKLSEKQAHYQTIRGSHAALIFSHQLEVVSFAEDVGRHNALDKAIGKAFMDRKLNKARLLVLSSRKPGAVRANVAMLVVF